MFHAIVISPTAVRAMPAAGWSFMPGLVEIHDAADEGGEGHVARGMAVAVHEVDLPKPDDLEGLPQAPADRRAAGGVGADGLQG